MNDVNIWLANGWQPTAHSVNGIFNKDIWKTPCGRVISYADTKGNCSRFNGIVISWKLLNQSEVKLCKVCFKEKSND